MPLRIAAKMREPAEHAYFSEEVAPLLGDEVEYVGEVGGADKLDLLADAACLLNPIAWPEPFGMVMIEALACGTPVVATPWGSVPELIREGITGFVRADAAGLVDAVRRVGSLDRSQCRKEAAERFSTERMVADHVALYERVIERHQRDHAPMGTPTRRHAEVGPRTDGLNRPRTRSGWLMDRRVRPRAWRARTTA